MLRSSLRVKARRFGSFSPLPKTFNRFLKGSIASVMVWLRTKNFSTGVR